MSTFPATTDDITEMVENIHFIEPGIFEEDLSSAPFNNSPALMRFVESHCHSSQYAFQLKKCLIQHPIVMDRKESVGFHFFPCLFLMVQRSIFSI